MLVTGLSITIALLLIDAVQCAPVSEPTNSQLPNVKLNVSNLKSILSTTELKSLPSTFTSHLTNDGTISLIDVSKILTNTDLQSMAKDVGEHASVPDLEMFGVNAVSGLSATDVKVLAKFMDGTVNGQQLKSFAAAVPDYIPSSKLKTIWSDIANKVTPENALLVGDYIGRNFNGVDIKSMAFYLDTNFDSTDFKNGMSFVVDNVNGATVKAIVSQVTWSDVQAVYDYANKNFDLNDAKNLQAFINKILKPQEIQQAAGALLASITAQDIKDFFAFLAKNLDPAQLKSAVSIFGKTYSYNDFVNFYSGSNDYVPKTQLKNVAKQVGSSLTDEDILNIAAFLGKNLSQSELQSIEKWRNPNGQNSISVTDVTKQASQYMPINKLNLLGTQLRQYYPDGLQFVVNEASYD